jgi:hypothetical protein
MQKTKHKHTIKECKQTLDHGFEIRSGQIKDYAIGICCFSGKQQSPLHSLFLVSCSKFELRHTIGDYR